jgi:NDP-sugar pyrophosphorylase family protein
MRPLTESCPKTLLPVCGRPFAYHQLHWLARQGVTEAVYAIGHKGHLIRGYWASEQPPVASIRYVDEGDHLRGTGGAIRLALEQGVLEESFLVIYGDSFLPVEFDPIWQAFQSSGKPALMTVLRNEGRWDRSNVIYEDGRVVLYDKAVNAAMHYIDYGLSAFRRDLFENIPDSFFDISTLFYEFFFKGNLAGFEVHDLFYEIGSPRGLNDLEEYLKLTIQMTI